MADITIIRNGARISLASFPKLGSGSENIAVAVSTSGAYDTYTTELYYGWYQGSSMQKALAKYQNGLYYIPSNALFNAGNVYLTLRLVSGDSKVSTNTIPITIEKSAVNNEYSILPASETWQNAVDNYINNSINLLNERIDNLEVGGRNLLPFTNNIESSSYGNKTLWNKESEKYLDINVYSSTSQWNGIKFNYDVKENETYTFSCYIKNEKIDDAYNNFIFIEGLNNNPDAATLACENSHTNWSRITATFKPSQSSSVILHVECSGEIKTCMCGFKLEKGTVPTDWTPALEDTQQIIINKSFSVNLEQGKDVEFNFSYSGDYVPNEISSVALSNTSVSSGYVSSYITHLLTNHDGSKTCYLEIINGTNATINDTVNVGVRFIKIQN